MKSNYVKLMLMRWLWPIALAVLASCGGGGSSSMPLSTFVATLDGAQETPPNASAATGSGMATVDTATKMLTATVTTTGIVGSAAHIHNGSPGISGPIIFPLTEMPAGSGNWSMTVTITDAQFNLLMSGGYYFNVHSTAFPNGEIRGQIVEQQSQSPQDGGGSGSSGGIAM